MRCLRTKQELSLENKLILTHQTKEHISTLRYLNADDLLPTVVLPLSFSSLVMTFFLAFF